MKIRLLTLRAAFVLFPALVPSLLAQPVLVTGPKTENSVFLGHTLTLSATATGDPLTYQWKAGPNGSNPATFTNVLNGGNQWGADTFRLTITNITMSQQLDYQLFISDGTATINTAVATTTLYPPPISIANSANYDYFMLTNGPGGVGAVDYWRLNDPSGLPIYDSGPGAKDGTVQNASLGYSGPCPPDFPGFEAGNTCMQTFGGSPNYAQTAPLHLNTNTVTFLAWVYPTANQNAGAGLLFSRQSGGTGPADFGLGYNITARPDGDYSLRYFWNGASSGESGLMVPQNLWSLVAVVMSPTNATLYVVNTNGMASWTEPRSLAVCAFSNPLTIGNDPADAGAQGTSSRTFTGFIDEVAAFTRSFTAAEIAAVGTNATRLSAFPPTASRVLPAPAVVILTPGASTNLSCTVSGFPEPTMQWMRRPLGLSGAYTAITNGGAFSGVQTNTLSITGASASMNGDYVLQVSNRFAQVTQSLPIRVLVVQANRAPALIGRWLTGDQSYAEKSLYFGSGVHDGVVAANVPDQPEWKGDVPTGFSGSSLAFGVSGSLGNALAITNTSTKDSDYRLDFDNDITNRFSVAFWAKGFPTGGWQPFVGKACENNPVGGWALRRGNNTGNNPIFSVVGPAKGVNSTYSGVDIRDGAWHHYAGTWDGSTGIRRTFVDGIEVAATYGDFGSVTPANAYHLVFGAEDNGSFFRWAGVSLFDVRMYNYALAQAEVQSMMRPGTDGTVGLALDATRPLPVGQPETFTVMIPPGANATRSVTVWVTNNSPSVVQFHGTTTNVLWVVFAQNAPNTQSFLLDTVGVGSISLSIGNNAGLGSSSIASADVVMPKLIGHWLTGAENLADSVNIDGSGAHDGMAVPSGTTATWDSADRPPAFSTGSSLNFASANYGLAIKGSSIMPESSDTYYPTFDVNLADGFSCAFWAKGVPSASYNPWVSKFGEGNGQPGWEIRQNGNSGQPSFRLMQTSGSAENADTFNSIRSFNPNDLGSGWHHYVASYDSMGGLRRLYIDGELSISIPNDFGPMPPQPYAYLVFGALDGASANQNPPTHGYSKFFPGKLFDARMYNYPLNGAEALAVMNATNTTALRAVADYKTLDVGHTGTINFSLPEGVTTATVTVNNLNPSVATIAGASGNSFTLSFSASTPRATRLTLTGVAAGQATIQFSAPGLTPASVTVQVCERHLVGHWLVGSQDLADHSGFTPAGTHDGVAYTGGTVQTPQYGPAPTGFPGKSLSIPTGSGYGIVISNTAATFGNPQSIDVNYQSTFDDLLANRFTIAFWANASTASGNWSGLVGKLGEGDAGYLVHRNAGSTTGDFVVRSTATHAFDLFGNANIYNSAWHHIAATWDGYTGIRTFYVDGQVDAIRTGDYGPMAMAPNHHLVFGSEEGDSIGAAYLLARNGYMVGNLYDVRIYNYALTQNEVNALRTFVPPSLTITPVSGGVQISWPASATGYTLQSATSLAPANWQDAGLSVIPSGDTNVATDTVGSDAKFYRLAK